MLRILSGEFARRFLEVPHVPGTRPTLSFVRESVFNVLDHRFQIHWPNTIILDAFAGSGVLGIEGLSRGAKKLYCAEKNSLMFRALKHNVATLLIHDRSHLWHGDVFLMKPPEPVNLIFIDPPYDAYAAQVIFSQLHEKGWITPHTLIVYESLIQPPDIDSCFRCLDSRSYTNCIVTYWKLEE